MRLVGVDDLDPEQFPLTVKVSNLIDSGLDEALRGVAEAQASGAEHPAATANTAIMTRMEAVETALLQVAHGVDVLRSRVEPG